MLDYLGSDAWSKDMADLSLFRVHKPGSDVRLTAAEMPLARAFLKGEIVGEEELEILRSDGTWAIVLGSAMPMKNQDGKLVGALAAFTDITRLKGLEANLKRSNEELQQFAYIASHDLREPLRYGVIVPRAYRETLQGKSPRF